jgi:hypothetical protein
VTMNFDLQGRVNNLKIPDRREAILYCCFEAISNAVHAIEDRFGDQATTLGNISIDVDLSADHELQSVVISDNGIGLDSTNFQSFETCDSQKKILKGGKGVGRLLWLKVFDRTSIASSFATESGQEFLKFDFEIDKIDPIKNPIRSDGAGRELGTSITFKHLRAEFNVEIRPSAFVRDVVLHFFSYFVSNSMPRVSLTIRGRTKKSNKATIREIDLQSHIKINVISLVNDERSIQIGETQHPFQITHIFANKKISNQLKNTILMSANRRVVEKNEIQNKFALNKLKDGNAYVMVASSALFDARVDQERTALKLSETERSTILDNLVNFAEEDLSDHVSKIRVEQRKSIESILTEHPQLSLIVKDVESYTKTLSPGMDEEAIGKTLFTLLYRDEKKISKTVKALSEATDLTEEAERQAKELAATIGNHLKHSLAEYVSKRRQILTIARKFLQKKDGEEKYHPEKAIHNLILPMGKIFESADYDAHNLWIIDDLLSYYSYFASDKSIAVIAPGSSDSKEPDAIFVNPHGFHRPETADPVVVIEFKRPGDEITSSDPVNQVLGYVERLVEKTVKGPKGETISEIKKGRTFQCFIVCDLSENMRKLFKRSLAAHEMPDGEGFFGYSPNHLATITVISYRKMLRDAEKRNRAFFDKLGIFQPGNTA